ncbi:hypothetical protein [Pseudobacteriovorax antillogorgiicola]|uniref:Uncharacterized protein n=1 Tax=Pseudobacteriovorax antillogorgiicola TaxID=1513793 RepID=A0A1Y6BEL3_9BACT|nr:hypothetical protein [Pseudobacteriovorax antillogorgiicola]TCS56303.1 hypothetical protein EDD56_104125 [Pseudobacteriovorax antillogorgiicola]SMF07317.1 hypothetical protein SAMN06296036_104208 [Pseudobacteriovorax antillogorgiicola]
MAIKKLMGSLVLISSMTGTLEAADEFKFRSKSIAVNKTPSSANIYIGSHGALFTWTNKTGEQKQALNLRLFTSEESTLVSNEKNCAKQITTVVQYCRRPNACQVGTDNAYADEAKCLTDVKVILEPSGGESERLSDWEDVVLRNAHTGEIIPTFPADEFYNAQTILNQ